MLWLPADLSFIFLRIITSSAAWGKIWLLWKYLSSTTIVKVTLGCITPLNSIRRDYRPSPVQWSELLFLDIHFGTANVYSILKIEDLCVFHCLQSLAFYVVVCSQEEDYIVTQKCGARNKTLCCATVYICLQGLTISCHLNAFHEARTLLNCLKELIHCGSWQWPWVQRTHVDRPN